MLAGKSPAIVSTMPHIGAFANATVRTFFVLPFALISASLLIGWPADAATLRTLTATIDRVADGDSVTATDARGDKPGQPFGQEARQYLDYLIGGKIVQVETHGPDQYKRVLAVIFDGQVNVNLLMVAMGYAEVYRGAPCQAYCEDLYRAVAKTKRDRVGMWVQGPKYESPAVFRRRMRVQGE